MNKTKIFLTGGTGMVGKNILMQADHSKFEIFAPNRSEVNLLDYSQITKAIKEFQPHFVIHAAGLVGGIQANNNALFDFMDKNMQMGLNVVRAARENKIKNLINLGSTCMYPKDAQQPMKEEYLFTGPLEPTNEGYAIAKTAIQRACDYTNKELGFSYKTYIPCNLFGIYDHFDPETSHLLPAIIKKITEAKEKIRREKAMFVPVEIWGTGRPRRELMDAADLANFIFFSIENFEKVPNVLNVSPGTDYSINELYQMVAKVLLGDDYKKIIFIWDKNKPDGMYRKLSDVSKLKSLGWVPQISFEQSVTNAAAYYFMLQETNNNNKKTQKIETKSKTAFITGVTGQDGSYLAEFLLEKGYKVVGMVRRNSQPKHKWLESIFSHPNFILEYGNLHDASSLNSILARHKPDEIYNLAAQSHVKISFECSEETFDSVAMGTLRLLNAARMHVPSARIYQAGSSEQFGFNPENPQNEKTVFMPASPYACAKVAAHNLCVNYRHAYNMFVSVGILHNHESPRRGEMFVTRKITKAAARIKLGLQDKLELGNIESKRDWGFAKEYVQVMWKILQHDMPDDFVISTGQTHSVKEFLEFVFKHAGLDVEKHVVINEALYRPHEVRFLWGDSKKAEILLGWKAETKFEQLAKIMYDADLAEEMANISKQ